MYFVGRLQARAAWPGRLFRCRVVGYVTDVIASGRSIGVLGVGVTLEQVTRQFAAEARYVETAVARVVKNDPALRWAPAFSVDVDRVPLVASGPHCPLWRSQSGVTELGGCNR